MGRQVKKMVRCDSCGAEFDATLVRCPYCGGGYAPAEENEYMDRLDDNRKELESHKRDGGKSLAKGLSKTIAMILLIIAAIVLLIGGGLSLSKKHESNRAAKQKQEFLSNQGIVTE